MLESIGTAGTSGKKGFEVARVHMLLEATCKIFAMCATPSLNTAPSLRY